MRKTLLLLLVQFIALSSFAQLIHDNMVYDPDIKSAIMTVNGEIESIPVIQLQSKDFFILTFDDLSNSEEDFYYRIIHCDRDWNKSELNEIDFITGFNDEVVEVWEYSELTEVSFTHFWAQFPNRNTRFKISGNYIIYVYQKDDEGEIPILTRRFIISENVANILVKPVRSSDLSKDRFSQQFDVEVGLNVKVENPMNDVKLTVIQNGFWDRAKKDIKPFSIYKNTLKFDPFGSLNFSGLTEFRCFDTRWKTAGGRGIESMHLKYGRSTAILYPEVNWSRRPYIYSFDFNGNYYVDGKDSGRTLSATDINNQNVSAEVRSSFSHDNQRLDGVYTFLAKDLNSDYIDIHFRLENEFVPQDVYVIGAFSDWKLKPEFKMSYDFDSEMYSCNAELKQGFYDYMFAIDTEDGPNLEAFQGSWFDTENEYSFIIYYSEFGTRYDRVLSVRKINTQDF